LYDFVKWPCSHW